MSRGSCPREAQPVIFYAVWEPLGAPDSRRIMNRVGPRKERCSRALSRFAELGIGSGMPRFNLWYSTRSGGSRKSSGGWK